jgi:hypothetical protein
MIIRLKMMEKMDGYSAPRKKNFERRGEAIVRRRASLFTKLKGCGTMKRRNRPVLRAQVQCLFSGQAPKFENRQLLAGSSG